VGGRAGRVCRGGYGDDIRMGLLRRGKESSERYLKRWTRDCGAGWR